MTYEEAKAYKQNLEEINNVNSEILNSFEKSTLGTTPEYIRALPEWEAAKNTFDISFAELRSFNIWFIKTYKKEYTNERRSKRTCI